MRCSAPGASARPAAFSSAQASSSRSRSSCSWRSSSRPRSSTAATAAQEWTSGVRGAASSLARIATTSSGSSVALDPPPRGLRGASAPGCVARRGDTTRCVCVVSSARSVAGRARRPRRRPARPAASARCRWSWCFVALVQAEARRSRPAKDAHTPIASTTRSQEWSSIPSSRRRYVVVTRQRRVVEERADGLDRLPGVPPQPSSAMPQDVEPRRRQPGRCEIAPEPRVARRPRQTPWSCPRLPERLPRRHRRQLLAAVLQGPPDGLPGGLGQLSSPTLPALAPVSIEHGAILDLDVPGLYRHDLGPSPAREDEDQQDGPVPSSLDAVGQDRQEPADLIGRVAPRR